MATSFGRFYEGWENKKNRGWNFGAVWVQYGFALQECAYLGNNNCASLRGGSMNGAGDLLVSARTAVAIRIATMGYEET
jgi:hypothetical protein